MDTMPVNHDRILCLEKMVYVALYKTAEIKILVCRKHSRTSVNKNCLYVLSNINRRLVGNELNK